MQNSRILGVENISHSYRDSARGPFARTRVLDKISFDIERGSFVSLMGPSGCGKSTLLRFIAGLQKPERGGIIGDYKKISMIFQNHAVFPWLKVKENVGFGLEMAGASKDVIEKTVKEKLEEVGLSGLGESYPNQLSGGQKQRVSVARALAVSPDLLLMDEPFSSLDSITSEKLKSDIFKLFKRYGMTVLMVNHLIEDAVELSDEVIVLSQKPATVKERIKIDLPFPRDGRSPQFFALVDKIRNLIEK